MEFLSKKLKIYLLHDEAEYLPEGLSKKSIREILVPQCYCAALFTAAKL